MLSTLTKPVVSAFYLIRLILAFLLFGLGALLLAFVCLPFVKLFLQSTNKINLWARQAVQFCWSIFLSYCSWTGLISLRVINPELINSAKGNVVVANHPSLLDVVILISLLPQSTCIVKDALKKNFFMKDVVSAAYIFNSSNLDQLLNECSASLKAGDNLVIFPEGTRTLQGEKKKLSRGAAQIALYSEADVLPIKITCEPPALLRGEKWYNMPHQKVVFTLEAQPLLSISKYICSSLSKKQNASQLTEEISKVLELEVLK